jgi:hypothetical protein
VIGKASGALIVAFGSDGEAEGLEVPLTARAE